MLTLGDLLTNIFEQGREQRLPVAGSFELTSRCNLRCKMCYVCQPANNTEVIQKELSTKDWLRIAEEARNAGALFITLTGGEIFLRKDFKEIYENLSMMGYRIVLYTNGTLITPEIAKWLGERPPTVVCITLYGGSREIYGKICGEPTGFDRVLRGIDLLLEQGIDVDLRTTIIKGNVDDYENMVEIAQSRGIVLDTIDYITPRREGVGYDPLAERLSPAELLEFRKIVAKHTTKDELEKQENSEKNLSGLKYNSSKFDYRSSNDAFRCVAGKCGFWVSWDGRLMPCGILDIPATKPLEIGFQEAWEKLKSDLTQIPSCKLCKKCEHLDNCSVCPAKLKLETGFLDKPALYLCELAKQAISS